MRPETPKLLEDVRHAYTPPRALADIAYTEKDSITMLLEVIG